MRVRGRGYYQRLPSMPGEPLLRHLRLAPVVGVGGPFRGATAIHPPPPADQRDLLAVTNSTTAPSRFFSIEPKTGAPTDRRRSFWPEGPTPSP